MGVVRAVKTVWDEKQPSVLGVLMKVILTIAAAASAPFWLLAVVFLLLQKPLLWVLVPTAIAVIIVAMGVLGWLFVRARLRELRGHLDLADRVEQALRE